MKRIIELNNHKSELYETDQRIILQLFSSKLQIFSLMNDCPIYSKIKKSKAYYQMFLNKHLVSSRFLKSEAWNAYQSKRKQASQLE